MERITLFDKTFRQFISNDEIEKAIDKVAEKINADYSSFTEPPVLLCILNGSIMFTAYEAAEFRLRADFHEIVFIRRHTVHRQRA